MDAGIDIKAQIAAGTFKSIRATAINAGIIYGPEDPEEASLERLYNAWRLASVETREMFLFLVEDWENHERPRRHGPRPDRLADEAPAVLLTLASRFTMAALAREMTVSRETVRRWCAGSAQPQKKHLDAMIRLAATDDTDDTDDIA